MAPSQVLLPLLALLSVCLALATLCCGTSDERAASSAPNRISLAPSTANNPSINRGGFARQSDARAPLSGARLAAAIRRSRKSLGAEQSRSKVRKRNAQAPTNATSAPQITGNEQAPADDDSGSRNVEFITKTLTPIMFGVIIVIGFVGNVVVIYVILQDRKTERELTPTNLLILDLSLADLSFICLCIPFTAVDYASGGIWPFGQFWCQSNQYLIIVSCLASIYTLVLMSIDRFVAIVYPIECIPFRNNRNTLNAIAVKWILILLLSSPTHQMHGLLPYHNRNATSDPQLQQQELPSQAASRQQQLVYSSQEQSLLQLEPDSPQQLQDTPLLQATPPDAHVCRLLSHKYNPMHFQISFFVTSYLLPLILILCLYSLMIYKLWHGNTKSHGHKESPKTLESKRKVSQLVAMIVVLFAVCWFPIQIMLILMRLKTFEMSALYVGIQVFAHVLGYLNSCINPLIYAFASETFVNSFRKSPLGRLLAHVCPFGCFLNGGQLSSASPTTATRLSTSAVVTASALAASGGGSACGRGFRDRKFGSMSVASTKHTRTNSVHCNTSTASSCATQQTTTLLSPQGPSLKPTSASVASDKSDAEKPAATETSIAIGQHSSDKLCYV